MKENNELDINELLANADPILTAEDLEDGSLLWDLVLESAYEVIEERVLYDNDGDFGTQMNNLSRAFELAGESALDSSRSWENWAYSGKRVSEWAEKTYGVSPMTGDSMTDLTLLFTDTTEEPVRPKKRGERCDFCSNMNKKKLKKYDSCPSCGRSLFALKSRGW